MFVIVIQDALFNTRLRQNGRIFPDNIFKCIFLNENDRIPITISLKYAHRSPIDNKPALVQVMAWRQTGDKPLSDPMMTQSTEAYICHSASMSQGSFTASEASLRRCVGVTHKNSMIIIS